MKPGNPNHSATPEGVERKPGFLVAVGDEIYQLEFLGLAWRYSVFGEPERGGIVRLGRTHPTCTCRGFAHWRRSNRRPEQTCKHVAHLLDYLGITLAQYRELVRSRSFSLPAEEEEEAEDEALARAVHSHYSNSKRSI